jgi:pilus assembly protein CpaE
MFGETGDSMDIIKVVLLEQAGEERNQIEEMLLSVEYILLIKIIETAKEIYEVLENNNIDVVLLGSGVEGDGYAISEKLSAEYPELAMIILEDQLQEETMHKAFFAGAKDVLIHPISPAHLIDSIYKSNQLTKKKILIHKDTSVKTKKQSNRGQVFTVFSTKGGVGKTFIATNLALTLAKNNKEKRVVLVDLDLDFGNIALALNILPRFTLSDIVDDIRNIDQDYIESYLTPYEAGIWVLPANIHPMNSEFINAQHMDKILRTLQNAFDYIVIDMPGRFHETINPAFAIADHLLMVVTPEISTIRNIKAALVTLNELNYPKSKIKIILNKANGHEIKNKDIETTLNFNLFATLIDDYRRVISTMNTGIPFVIKNPYSMLTKDFNKMVRKLVDPS